MPVFFGMETQGIEDVAATLPIFAAGFIFIGFSRVTTSCFYAVKKNVYAYVLIYGELVGIGILASLLLPPIWGITGVWMSVPVTQAILAALAVVLLKRTSSKEHINKVEVAAFEEIS